MADRELSHRTDFAACLRTCAQFLEDGRLTGSPLRELQRHSQRLMDVAEGDTHLRTLAFIVDQWIKDYYFNFVGDVISTAWREVEEVRIRLLSRDTSSALRAVAESVVADLDKGLGAVENLVCTYLNAIKKANDEVNRAMGKGDGQERATV